MISEGHGLAKGAVGASFNHKLSTYMPLRLWKGVSLPVVRLCITPPDRPKTTRLPISQMALTEINGRLTSAI